MHESNAPGMSGSPTEESGLGARRLRAASGALTIEEARTEGARARDWVSKRARARGGQGAHPSGSGV
jgi:hypothetical protein